jgi:exodeoxyribonuclease VII large subunit
VLVYPVPVQGAGAAEQIAAALRLASQRKDCDALILARGGGSLEDLWAFNEEIVARAIHDCDIPVITGIGHEIDFTIADFVADRRAPTPTGAAELAVPDSKEWLQHLGRLENRLIYLAQQHARQKAQTLGWLEKRLQQQHPGQRLRLQAQRLDELEQRLQHARRSWFRHATARLTELSARLHRYIPVHRLEQMAVRTENLSQRLNNGMQRVMEQRRQHVASLARALDAVSPLATLGRGYAIVNRWPDRTIVRSVKDVSAGDMVETRLAEGRLICIVNETLPE